MGNRPLSISLATGIAVLVSVGSAGAQTGPRAPVSPDPLVQPSPKPAQQVDSASPAAPDKAKRSTPAVPSAVDPYIVNRPPVRREVHPKVQEAGGATPSKATQKAQAAQPAQGSPSSFATTPSAAASANNAAAADAAAASAGRKMWPVVIAPTPDAGAHGAAAQQSQPAWTEVEINEAKAYCSTVLKGVDVGMVPEDPIKQGECGSPVLFKVTSIGKAPAVEVSPPVILTCDMIASLDKWIKREVQPQARAHLGSTIVKLETMSSYSCRNAYGRAKTRLSEHGKANAIDISGFATIRDTTTVLAGWGPTLREQRAIAQRLEVERAGQTQAQSQPQTQPQIKSQGLATGLPRTTAPSSVGSIPSPPSVPGVVISGPSGFPGGGGFGFGPSRLGGPKVAEKAAEQPAKSAPGDAASKQKFLREIHTSACKYFGTVLGPEANNAHRNHFHLDMAPRKTTNFCE